MRVSHAAFTNGWFHDDVPSLASQLLTVVDIEMHPNFPNIDKTWYGTNESESTGQTQFVPAASKFLAGARLNATPPSKFIWDWWNVNYPQWIKKKLASDRSTSTIRCQVYGWEVLEKFDFYDHIIFVRYICGDQYQSVLGEAWQVHKGNVGG